MKDYEELRKERVEGVAFPLWISLSRNGESYRVEIDGVEWLTVSNQMHAIVLFEMMRKHISEYMHYEQAGKGE